ncbi:MAG: ATP-dependent sacrificial sulfur transferase LarE [Planctomycetes bacterium]|nr:ATP-dependent sacrificial sulfur transferase LarE [Planctomycetota bacterium]
MVFKSRMTELSETLLQKRDALLEILSGYGRVAVAFSGGVDSAVVAYAAHRACGDHAVAVTAESPSLASGELEASKRLAELIGIRHRVIRTEEFENPDYLKNASDRCYFCKTELYNRLESLLPELEAEVIVNGANCDDRGDYRPGLQAASEHHVCSPLIEAGLGKSEVRELAMGWQLRVWDKPATPCLSSRIAYGLEVTPERIRRVDQAERFLREEFGFREFRVRHEANDLARIEVPVSELDRFFDPETRGLIAGRLHALGFKYVTLDLEGFRSGSMNAVLPLESLKMPQNQG